MNNTYDNWERLVGAVLKREEFRSLARATSRESSLSSLSADFSSRFSFSSPVQDPEASSSSSTPFHRKYSMTESFPILRCEGWILPLPDVPNPISFKELIRATSNFRRDSFLDYGYFGPVYKGWIDTPGRGLTVAITSYNGMPGFKEWLKEVWQLHHPNLTKLIAYCDEGDNQLLVHEFMPKTSLYDFLFRRSRCLSWGTRIKVAIGAARGLYFLHYAKHSLIHGNFESSEILLDEEFNVKLSVNFGYAKYLPSPFETPLTISYVSWDGIGYSAPEYRNEGVCTKKCDVYAFGVVLLELLSGHPGCSSIEGRQFLLSRIIPHLSSKRGIHKVVDRKLKGKYPHEGASAVAALALQCVSSNSNERPDMADVLAALERLQDLLVTQSTSDSNLYANDEKKILSTFQIACARLNPLQKLFVE